MRRKAIALALALLVLVSLLPAAAAADRGRVVFESGPADANGVFTVTMKVSDMTVWGIQFALKYDPQVIQPVDAKGNAVDGSSINDAISACESWLDAFSTDFKPGVLGGAFLIPPGASSDRLNQYGNVEVGSEGLDVATIRFKRLTDGNAGLEIASEAKGEPYQADFPEGVMAVNVDDEFPVEVIFREADKPESGKSESFVPTTSVEPVKPAEPAKTAEDLLREAVILKIGSHAAVVNGGNVAAIYFGERDVTAYAHDNRTFVPLRFAGERLGATVDWDNDTQTAIVEKDGHRIEMPIGSSTYYLDGEAKTLDAPAELTPSTNGNSRTMVPVRFVSEALGYQVEWDPARDLVVIVPKSLGWDPAGEAEAQAMDKAVTNLLIYSNFV